MDRETALKQLKDIRQEIVGIHEAFNECQYYSQKVQELQNEKENPTGPKLSLKPDNTAEQLKRSFLAENERHYKNDRPGVLVVKIFHAIIQALILVLIALDGHSDLGVIANNSDHTLLNARDNARNREKQLRELENISTMIYLNRINA